uniref:Uncharacterized protein n=1 Tax=Leersia perrieri TaxID=77586 RepID=A0A0D9WI42_9ORYZ
MEVLAGVRPLSGRARQVSGGGGRSREELLGLLADFSGDGDGGDAGRELSFSDFLVADTSPKPSRAVAMTSTKPPPLLPAADGQEETAAESKQQQQAAAARERRTRRRRSDIRGSCGGGGDGVLLNFYVPGLLTRSTTAPRHGRGAISAAAPASATATAAGKARIGAPPSVGCWTALWGRDSRKPAKPAAGRRETRVPV